MLLVYGPRVYNQVDKFIKNSKKMLITCIYNNQLFFLAKKTFKTRLVLRVAFREHNILSVTLQGKL